MKVELEQVSFCYSKKKSLYQNLNLDIELDSSCIAIIGHNGAGKTTLIELMMGLLKPNSGKISRIGFDQVAYVPYKNQLYDFLTVRENLNYWYQLYNNKPLLNQEQLQGLINQLQIEHVLDIRCQYLSSGESKKASLACMLLSQLSVCFLDEPFNGVDPISVDIILQLIQEEMEKGRSFILTTHQLDLLDDVLTEVLILKEGTVVAQIKKKDLKQSVRDLYRHHHE